MNNDYTTITTSLSTNTTEPQVPAPLHDGGADDLSDVLAEQQAIADLDTCIRQAGQALRMGRESVARSFLAQKGEEGALSG
jgi:hypothetical protein